MTRGSIGAVSVAACLVFSYGCFKTDHERVQVSERDCLVCHQLEYDETRDPPHPGVFPTMCGDCHSTEMWRPAEHNHSWLLTGRHLSTPCGACHTGNPPVYAGLTRECVGCHQADYNSSPFPGHGAFSTTCQDCHSTVAWTPAMAGIHPNDLFPIQDGAHRRVECLSCHNADLGSPVEGMNTDCVGCHEGEHTRSRMDEKHREVRNYPAGPAAPNFCLSCHPNGKD